MNIVILKGVTLDLQVEVDSRPELARGFVPTCCVVMEREHKQLDGNPEFVDPER